MLHQFKLIFRSKPYVIHILTEDDELITKYEYNSTELGQAPIRNQPLDFRRKSAIWAYPYFILCEGERIGTLDVTWTNKLMIQFGHEKDPEQ